MSETKDCTFESRAPYPWDQEIAALKAENARLRRALEEIAVGNGIYGAQAGEYKAIARAALEEKP